MHWLSHDGVRAYELPDWADAQKAALALDDHRIRLFPQGLLIEEKRRFSVVLWDDILATIPLTAPKRLLIACARKPPLPPYFELSGKAMGELSGALHLRLSNQSQREYRQSSGRPEALSEEETLARVLKNEPVGGAVEIRASLRKATVPKSAGMTALISGGAVQGGLLLGPIGVLGGAALGAAFGTGLLMASDHWRQSNALRVLVLTPDAFVGGLDGRKVGAFAWPRVGGFGQGRDLSGLMCLEVRDPKGELLSRTAEGHFEMPLSAIIAIAEAYGNKARRLSR